jgi:hypothetical protein
MLKQAVALWLKSRPLQLLSASRQNAEMFPTPGSARLTNKEGHLSITPLTLSPAPGMETTTSWRIRMAIYHYGDWGALRSAPPPPQGPSNPVRTLFSNNRSLAQTSNILVYLQGWAEHVSHWTLCVCVCVCGGGVEA